MAIKPKALKGGDIIGLVAPSSPTWRREDLYKVIKTVPSFGYDLKIGDNVRQRAGYLAGTDHNRAKDLQKIFKDRSVRAIWALRGGYGSIRILPLLNYGIFRKHPKPFIGYSDTTALHLAMHKYSNLVTFHGPSAVSIIAKQNNSSIESLFTMLDGSFGKGGIAEMNSYMKGSIEVVRGGTAEGVLIGGNLSVIASMVGTPYMPSLKGKILFLEDINTAPFRIDRLLTQLILSGSFKGIAGIALGSFIGCDPPGM